MTSIDDSDDKYYFKSIIHNEIAGYIVHERENKEVSIIAEVMKVNNWKLFAMIIQEAPAMFELLVELEDCQKVKPHLQLKLRELIRKITNFKELNN